MSAEGHLSIHSMCAAAGNGVSVAVSVMSRRSIRDLKRYCQAAISGVNDCTKFSVRNVDKCCVTIIDFNLAADDTVVIDLGSSRRA